MPKSSTRLIAAFSLIALAAIALLGSQIWSDRNKRLETLQRNLLNYTLITEEAIQASLDTANTSLHHLAMDLGEHPEKIRPSFQPVLLAHRKPLESIRGLDLMIADRNGKLVASTTPGNPPHVDVSDREYFRELRNAPPGSWALSEPIYGKVQGFWVIILARRISDQRGSFVGVALASIEISFFSKLRSKIDLGDHSLFTVVSGHGKRFFYRYPPREELLGTAFIPNDSFKPVVSGELHRGVYNSLSKVDGIRRSTAISWIGNYPILVVIGRDIDDYLREWRRTSLRSAVGLLLILTVGFQFLVGYLREMRKSSQQQTVLANSSKFAALGQMAGGIAHEINNPLAIIMSRAEVLREWAKSGPIPPTELSSSLDKIIETASRISKIIQGLKAVSRDSALVHDVFPVQRAMEETLGIARERFLQNGIPLHVKVSAPDAVLLGNEVQFVQVLLNLLNNAFDAVASLPEKWVEVQLRARKGRLIVSITDSGNGIPPDVVNRIMEPFFTTKDIGKGTGLGLSISKGIIEAHGGTLRYDPLCPHTRFIIDLPLASGEAKADENLRAA